MLSWCPGFILKKKKRHGAHHHYLYTSKSTYPSHAHIHTHWNPFSLPSSFTVAESTWLARFGILLEPHLRNHSRTSFLLRNWHIKSIPKLNKDSLKRKKRYRSMSYHSSILSIPIYWTPTTYQALREENGEGDKLGLYPRRIYNPVVETDINSPKMR